MFFTITQQFNRYLELAKRYPDLAPAAEGLKSACEKVGDIEQELTSAMLAPVLVPVIGTPEQTSALLLHVIQAEYGGDTFVSTVYRQEKAENLMERLRFRVPPIGASGVVFLDFESHVGGNPDDHRDGGVTIEGLAAILMQPRWVQCVRTQEAPTVWIPGFQPLGVRKQDVPGGLSLYRTRKSCEADVRLVLADIGYYKGCLATVLEAVHTISA